MTTVDSFTAVTADTVFSRSRLWNAGFLSRSKLNTTSDARILRPRSGSKSCQFTSGRNTTVSVSVSSIDHSVQMSHSKSPA